MKRWLWLLVMPYMVIKSTDPYRNGYDYYRLTFSTKSSGSGRTDISCRIVDDCEWLFDIAAALNEVHKQRTKQKPKMMKGKLVPPCGDHDPSYFGNRGCYVSYEYK